MTIDPRKQLKATENKDQWKVDRFEYFYDDEDDGGWKPFGSFENVQAFDEKFDSFGMIAASAAPADGVERNSKERPRQRLLKIRNGEDKPQVAVRACQFQRYEYNDVWHGSPKDEVLSGVALYRAFLFFDTSQTRKQKRPFRPILLL